MDSPLHCDFADIESLQKYQNIKIRKISKCQNMKITKFHRIFQSLNDMNCDVMHCPNTSMA